MLDDLNDYAHTKKQREKFATVVIHCFRIGEFSLFIPLFYSVVSNLKPVYLRILIVLYDLSHTMSCFCSKFCCLLIIAALSMRTFEESQAA